MNRRNIIAAVALCAMVAGAPAAQAGVIYADANPWPEWTPMYWMHEMLKLMEEDGRFIDRSKLAALREYYLGDYRRARGGYGREAVDPYYRRSRLDWRRRDPYLRSSYGWGSADPYARRYPRIPGYSRYDGRGGYRISPYSRYGRAGYDPYLLPYGRGGYAYDRYGYSGYDYDPYRRYGYSPYGRVAYQPYARGPGSYGYDRYGYSGYGYDPYRRVAYQPYAWGRGGYGYYRGYNNAYYPGYYRGYGQWNRPAAPANRYSRYRQARNSRWDMSRILDNASQSSPWSGVNPMQNWGATNSFNPMNSWNPTQQFNPMNSFNPAQAWNPGNAFNPLNSMNPLGGGSPSWMPSTGGSGLGLPWGGAGGKGGSGFNPGSFFQKTRYRYP